MIGFLLPDTRLPEFSHATSIKMCYLKIKKKLGCQNIFPAMLEIKSIHYLHTSGESKKKKKVTIKLDSFRCGPSTFIITIRRDTYRVL